MISTTLHCAYSPQPCPTLCMFPQPCPLLCVVSATLPCLVRVLDIALDCIWHAYPIIKLTYTLKYWGSTGILYSVRSCTWYTWGRGYTSLSLIIYFEAWIHTTLYLLGIQIRLLSIFKTDITLSPSPTCQVTLHKFAIVWPRTRIVFVQLLTK